MLDRPTVPVDRFVDFDNFMRLYTETKSPKNREFLRNLYDTAPHVFGANGIVISAEVASEIRALTTREHEEPAVPQPKRRDPTIEPEQPKVMQTFKSFAEAFSDN